MKIEAARRLVQSSLITESRVVLRAVIECLRDNHHAADYTDDDHDMVLVRATMDEVVENLDAARWTIANEHVLDGGLYASGKAVIMTGGVIDLKLMQTSPGRVLICENR